MNRTAERVLPFGPFGPTEPVAPVDGYLTVGPVTPDPARLQALAAPPQRRQWWIDRIRACYPLLS